MGASPIIPIRFSPPRCPACGAAFNELTDRLNKAMTQLEMQLRGLQNQIAAQAAATSKAAAGKPGYPGIENGSDAMIQGPVPGGPSPIPPFITPHTMIVGEGSTPVKLLTFTNGQVPIGATGGDPAAANITGSGISFFVGPVGVAVQNGPNTITIGLDTNLVTWIVQVASFLDAVAADLGLGGDLPSPNPPDGY